MEKKRIGVLTSGGDCPGLNAVIRAVAKSASRKGWDVYGIPYGTDGFIDIAEGKRQPQDLKLTEHGYDLPGILQGLDVLQFLSGSILGSLSKGHPEQPEIAQAILEGYQKIGLDALVAVGGDGSLHIIYDLARKGNWNLIAIPKTIDNDVPFTELSVGFNTAVEIVTQSLYDLTFTAAAHDRVMVVQAMGRDAGHLALHAGIAAGADIILLPELTPYLSEAVIDGCCRQIARLRSQGRKFALAVIAEGVKDRNQQKEKYIGDHLADCIKEQGKFLCNNDEQAFCELDLIDTRVTVLGHLQRSRTPSSLDRLLATSFGIQAVELIDREQYERLIVWKEGRVQTEPLAEVIDVIKKRHAENRCPHPVEEHGFMVRTAQSLGIYLGNRS